MSKREFATNTIREQAGQFQPVSERTMIQAGVERMGCCEACGKRITRHYGVMSPDGDLMWVGSECSGVLCAPDAPELMFAASGRKIEKLPVSRELINAVAAQVWTPGYHNGQLYQRSGCVYGSVAQAARDTIRRIEGRGYGFVGAREWATADEIAQLEAMR